MQIFFLVHVHFAFLVYQSPILFLYFTFPACLCFCWSTVHLLFYFVTEAIQMYIQLINITWNFRCWQVYVFCTASRFRSWWGQLGRIMLQSNWIVHGFLSLNWIIFKLLHKNSFLLLCSSSRCSVVSAYTHTYKHTSSK